MSGSDDARKPVDVDSMMAGMESALAADEAEGKLAGLTVERLKKAVSHPKAEDVISEMMALEPSVVRQGEPAPDFSLRWLQGASDDRDARVTLSDHFGKKPVALIFGSYT